MTTLSPSGQQWDAPNGWAPLQWVAIVGLRGYGRMHLADHIADRWLAMVGKLYAESGQLFEKYDVVACSAGAGGEYATETGFGWTNGVTLELMAARDAGVRTVAAGRGPVPMARATNVRAVSKASVRNRPNTVIPPDRGRQRSRR